MGLLRLVLLCLLGRCRLRSEEAFAFLACHVIYSKEKSRPCTSENIIKDDSGQLIFVLKWIMILVGCDAIWPLILVSQTQKWPHCSAAY
jgi:hypothetical protein